MKNRFSGDIQAQTFSHLAEMRRMSARFRNRLGRYLAIARNKPSWLFMFVFSRILVARTIRKFLYRTRYTTHVVGNTAFTQVEAQSFINKMKRHGVAEGLMLSADIVKKIQDFSLTSPCYGNSDPTKVLYIKDEVLTQPVGEYIIADYQDGIANCPAIKQLWNDSILLSIARGYMGMEPHLLRSRLWWSFVVPGANTTERSDFSQAFHFDLDDWICCKFFFYITETTHLHGPHEYVTNSHRRRPLSMQLSAFKRQSETTVHRVYGRNSIRTLTGPAGFGFVEDPFGIHRGTQPTGQARLILEVEYGCTPRQAVAGRFGVLEH
jgi:hypothetical protein